MGDDSAFSQNNIGGIYFGAEYLLKTFRGMYYTSDGNINKDYTLFNFIKKIWEEVNACTQSGHDFDIQTDNRGGCDIVRIIDRQMDNSGESVKDPHVLKIQTLDSVVRDVTYNTTIPSSLSSTIAIAAQSPDSIDDLDKVSFAALNKGIKDRFSIKTTTNNTPSDSQIIEWNNKFDGELIKVHGALYLSGGGGVNIGNGGALINLLYRDYQSSRNYILKEDMTGMSPKNQSSFKGALKNVISALNYFQSHYGSTDKKLGYYRGQPASDGTQPLSAVIPLKFNAKLDGISGIVIGNVFKIPKDRLPMAYGGNDINFIVMGEEQSIDGNQDWTTTISGHLILLGSVASEEYQKSKHYKSWKSPTLTITQGAYDNAPELGDLSTGVIDDYIPGSTSFDAWPNSELTDPLRTMVITSPFGPRTINGQPDDHGGIDLKYHPKDEQSNGYLPFYAIGDGTIKIKLDPTNKDGSGTQGACGGTITLTLDRDPINLTSNFSDTSPKRITHCHVIGMVGGHTLTQKVKKGDVIGFVGGDADDAGSGNSSSRHLHMTYATKHGVKINPAKWLPGVGGENNTKGSNSLLDYGNVDGDIAVDQNGQTIIRPRPGKDNNWLKNQIQTITPTAAYKEEAMLVTDKVDEQTWYLVRDGFMYIDGFMNDQTVYVRISAPNAGAFVLDDISRVKYDPSWFTSGGNVFLSKTRQTYGGKVSFPLYDKNNFEGSTMNFPNHMHYTKTGMQVPPNAAANAFSEYEIAFSNVFGDSNNSKGIVHNS